MHQHHQQNQQSVIKSHQPPQEHLIQQQQQQQYSVRTNSSETFKLVEKAQPKKSRTKYTKDQVSTTSA